MTEGCGKIFFGVGEVVAEGEGGEGEAAGILRLARPSQLRAESVMGEVARTGQARVVPQWQYASWSSTRWQRVIATSPIRPEQPTDGPEFSTWLW